jgi:signal transduction histidine kinase
LGLGLYITDQIVRGHGGRITVTSSDDVTRFTILLPRHAGIAVASFERATTNAPRAVADQIR